MCAIGGFSNHELCSFYFDYSGVKTYSYIWREILSVVNQEYPIGPILNFI